MTESGRMYLELHDISTGWCPNQTRAHILGMLVQHAHVSWVLIVIHHLQAKTQRTCGQTLGLHPQSWDGFTKASRESLFHASFPGGSLSGEQQCRRYTRLSSVCCVSKIKINWNKLIKAGFRSQHCILSLHAPPPTPFLSHPRHAESLWPQQIEVRVATYIPQNRMYLI